VEAQTGTALISMKTGTSVIPVACIGTKHFLPFRTVKVVFGQPIKYLMKMKPEVNSKKLDEFSQPNRR
jgi:1-acyl-sn-glycerol-3-phosphate acyltransferase